VVGPWWRYAAPGIEAKETARLDGLRASQGAGCTGWGGGLVTGNTNPSYATRALIVARVATASCSGGLGLGTGVEHPMDGMFALAGLVIVALAFVVLAVCLGDRPSERLFRWVRLILGREEPPNPHVTTVTALQGEAVISRCPCHMCNG
jgi:hypothetical protein